MAKYVIDTDKFVEHLEKELNYSKRVEASKVGEKAYEDAIFHREQQKIIGNLLVNITGSKYFKPKTVENGGFMREVEE